MSRIRLTSQQGSRSVPSARLLLWVDRLVLKGYDRARRLSQTSRYRARRFHIVQI
jgi:hypothetical protein